MKMMMVRQIRRLVTGGLARYIDRLDVPFLDQTLEGPIDGSNAQAGNIGLSFG